MARAPVLSEVETVPEADRLDGFPHPREAAALIGHEAAEADAAQSFAADRVHHAWLITGREGIGKATFAYRLARFALAKPDERGAGDDGPLSVPPESTASRQVKVLSHPGLLVIRRPWDPKAKRFATSIPVDEVRRLKSYLAHAASPGTWRVVVVDQADELNINAANALLKSLEEPPPRALFLLVSSQPGRLLTTIRSRCRRLELQPLESDPLRRAVAAACAAAGAEGPPAPYWQRLETLAHGSVRRALVLSGADGLKLYDKVLSQIGLLPKVDWQQVHGLADELTGAGADQRFEQFFELFSDLLARLIRARATGGGTEEDERMAARMIPANGLAGWAELWETVLARKSEAMALNLDRKSLVLEIFARMQAASRG